LQLLYMKIHGDSIDAATYQYFVSASDQMYT
jgi:hypothetical protein